jgi:hypothetical protein
LTSVDTAIDFDQFDFCMLPDASPSLPPALVAFFDFFMCLLLDGALIVLDPVAPEVDPVTPPAFGVLIPVPPWPAPLPPAVPPPLPCANAPPERPSIRAEINNPFFDTFIAVSLSFERGA